MNLRSWIRKITGKRSALKTLGVDLVKQSTKLFRVVGRDEQIDCVERILVSASSKKIPLLTGVGIAAVGEALEVVDGLAQRIASGRVLGDLKGARLIALDTDALFAGGGDFEERLEAVAKEVEESGVKVILFIDRIHLVIEAGKIKYPVCAYIPLRSMLARGQLRCIGTTTPEEYSKYMDDPAFVKMFRRVSMTEPCVPDIAPSLKQDTAVVNAPQLSAGTGYTAGKDALFGLADKLHERVVGQDQAVEAVSTVLRVASSGIFATLKQRQPFASFLFLGPTGVGKSELAEAIAEQLFGSKDHLLRFDMSVYTKGHPVGYAGVRQLMEAVRRRQHIVVLFDQLEMADQLVFNNILRILDDGELRDDQGRVVDFSHTVIIMSSNAGAEHLLAGFLGKITMKTARDLAMQEVKKFFKRPEVLVIVDEIVFFDPLSHDQLKKIARLKLNSIAVGLAKKWGVALEVSDAALDYALLSQHVDQVYDAWLIRRWLDNTIVEELAKVLPLGEELGKFSSIYIDALAGEEGFSYHVETKKNGGQK